MKSRSRRVLGDACGLLLIVAASSCALGRSQGDTEVQASKCVLKSDPFVVETLMAWTTGGPTHADLSDARAYRNYMAVTAIWPVGHHFTVSSQGAMADLRVERDPGGHLTITREGYFRGDPGLAPPSISPIPPDVRPLADELEAELKARCGSTLDLKLQYSGRNRSVIVAEFIAHDLDGRGTRRAGWKAAARVLMDESLTRIVGVVKDVSWFGSIELPETAQWLALPQQSGGPRLLLVETEIRGLSEELAEAARRHDAQAPALALASLVPAGAPMLPPGFVSRVQAKLSISGQYLVVPLDIHDAVFGAGASGDGTVTLGRTQYRLHATLSPSMPRTPQPGRTSDKYAGTLELHLEDDRGHTWDRTYPVQGELQMEGASVVAPWGFDIPQDTVSFDERRGQLPGPDPGSLVHVYVDVELSDDPRQ